MSAGKTSLPSEFKQLGQIATQMIGQTQRPRKLLLKQLTEALSTGGVKAKIPMIQQAVSRSKQATASALTQTSESLASKNIGGPFGARIMAGQRQAGEQMTGAIPTQMAEQLIQQTMPFLSATQSLGAGALAQTGQASFASDAFNAQQFKALMQDIRGSLQGAGMAACLHPNSMVETPTGARRVADLNPGDEVWTVGTAGGRVPAKVTMFVAREVGRTHRMLKLQAPGGEIIVSPNHPLPNGTPIERAVCGVYVTSAEVDTTTTCDIEVDGPTGVYFVKGFALGSTLDSRHQIRRRVA